MPEVFVHRRPVGALSRGEPTHLPTESVSLAPTFDIVTTAADLPHDTLALMLDGTKRWPDAKRLVRFARQRCLLTEKAAREIVAEVIEAVAQVSHDLKDMTELDPRAGEIADCMRIAWAQGIASLKV